MQLAALQPIANVRNRPRGVGVVGKVVDLDVILRPCAPSALLRERMPRTGDDAPAGADMVTAWPCRGSRAGQEAGCAAAYWRKSAWRSFRLWTVGDKAASWIMADPATPPKFDAVVQAERASRTRIRTTAARSASRSSRRPAAPRRRVPGGGLGDGLFEGKWQLKRLRLLASPGAVWRPASTGS